jgi:hypothetical protein
VGEDRTKLSFNSQDPFGFTDVTEIGSVQQNISVVNENSTVSSSDRSSIQFRHYPVTSVTRVFNVTTGERYVVSSQNPDGTESTNETGRITISGQSLPAVSDVLQIDYTWIFSYDPYFDFDNRTSNRNPRDVADSVDWGFSNAVRRERVTLISSGSYLTATVTHPVSSAISVNAFSEESGTVSLSSERLIITVSSEVSNVVSVIRDSDGVELWNTNTADGTFSSQTIYLPTDTVGVFGDYITVVYNAVDVYNATTQGSFSDNVITIVPSATATAGTIVECNYISDISELLPATLLPALPAIRSSNVFDTNTLSSIGVQPTTHTFLPGGTVDTNLRQAPTNLKLTISGSISAGTLTVTGTTVTGVFEAVFVASSNGLKQDLSTSIRAALGLSSVQSVPSNVKVARVVKVEKVTTNDNLDVLSSDNTYDLKGYHVLDNALVKDESASDVLLTATEFQLPSTTDNDTNQPSVGDKLRVSFYIMTSSDTESVSFSKSGSLYTNKRFALVDIIAVSSGFTSGTSSSATLTVAPMNQPLTKSKYTAYYDYLSPKTNERITIRYNQDKIIEDVTLEIEDARPINADVLVKSSTPVPVDVTMNIVVTSSFTNSSEIVKQDVQDVLTGELNAQSLGTTIDSSDLITAAYTVSGVDRARILYFNETGETGSVLSITAQKNEYISANTVSVVPETR